MIEVKFVGQGTYAVVTTFHPGIALKWIRTWRPDVSEMDRLDNEHETIIATEAEAVDELLVFYLLSQLRVPGFPAYHGAVYITTPEKVGSLAYHPHTHYLCVAHRMGTPPAWIGLHPGAVRHALFSLLFSLVSAQIAIGFQHRDISIRNIVLDPAAAAAAENHVVRYQVGANHVWDITFDASHDPGIPFFIDFGFSTFVDVPTQRYEPHVASANLAMHCPPELYFTNEPDGTPLHRRRDEHADLFQLGIVFATILGLSAVNDADRETLFGSATATPTYDLVDEITAQDFKRLRENFVKVLTLDVLPVEIPTRRERTAWKIALCDENDHNGKKYHRLLGILCLMHALGLGYLPPPTYEPFQSSTFYRLMTHPAMVTFMADRVAPSSMLQGRFDRLVKRIQEVHGDTAIELLRRLLQWDPEQRAIRPHEAHFLLTMKYFTPLRQYRPDLPLHVDKTYAIESRPTLTAGNNPTRAETLWKDCREVRERVAQASPFKDLREAMGSLEGQVETVVSKN